MLTTSISLLLALAVLPFAVANDAEPKPALTVSVKPDKKQVQPNEPLAVKLRVVNSSTSPQTIRVMSCSWYQHWKSSNEKVTWSVWPCFRNGRQTVALEPGEAYEKSLEVQVSGKAGIEVAFKMGFTPIESKQTFWSEEAKVQIVK